MNHINLLRIPLAKSRSVRGRSHQPAFVTAAWILVTCGRSVNPVVDDLRPCVLWPLVIRLICVLLTLFWHEDYGFIYRELMLFYWIGVEFKDKSMVYCFMEVKCKQGFTTGIWYYLYNALGLTVSMCIRGLMVSKSEFRYGDPWSFPGSTDLLFNCAIFMRILMKKWWVGNRVKRVYGEMWGNAIRRGGTCKNPWDCLYMINVYDGQLVSAQNEALLWLVGMT